jgi:hypothetical protein
LGSLWLVAQQTATWVFWFLSGGELQSKETGFPCRWIHRGSYVFWFLLLLFLSEDAHGRRFLETLLTFYFILLIISRSNSLKNRCALLLTQSVKLAGPLLSNSQPSFRLPCPLWSISGATLQLSNLHRSSQSVESVTVKCSFFPSDRDANEKGRRIGKREQAGKDHG